MPTHKEYYTTAQLAEKLETNPQVIRQSRVSGMLYGLLAPKFIKLGKSKILYPTSEVDLYLSKRELQRITY